METQQHNKLVFIALLIPIIFIGIVLAVIYVPALGLSSDYNFVYAVCSNSTTRTDSDRVCSNHIDTYYEVTDGKISLAPTFDRNGDKLINEKDVFIPRLFIHDTNENVSREVTLEELQDRNIIDRLTSPDGMHLERDYTGGGGFLFFDSRGSYEQYLIDGNRRRRMHVIATDNSYYYYDNQIKLLGWVLR